ncbi:MAG: PH domain-containing protein, partial [bacterium]
ELKKPQGSNLGFAKFLSNLVMLRFEEDGKITYRTHWLIMLKKLITPTLVLVLLQLILIARLTGLITIADPVSMLIIIGMLDLAGLLWWTYQFFDWRNDYYVLTQDQIMDVYKKPLGTEDKRAAPLRNIQSINFKRNGLLGILFNYGTVYILIGDNQLTFNNVFNPSEVQREIFNRLYAMEYKQKLDEEKAEQLRIREWIEAYNRVLLDMESAQTQPSQDAYETEPATPEEQNGENQGTIALDENKGEH